MGDLFEPVRAEKRIRLTRLGWTQSWGKSTNRIYWTSPDGKLFTEQEAFDWLEGKEIESQTEEG